MEDLLEIEWSIIINEQFTPTTEIAKIGDKEIRYPALAKAVYLIGSGEKFKPNTVLMKIKKIVCRH